MVLSFGLFNGVKKELVLVCTLMDRGMTVNGEVFTVGRVTFVLVEGGRRSPLSFLILSLSSRFSSEKISFSRESFEARGNPFLFLMKAFLISIETENGVSINEKFKFDFLTKLIINSQV